ncbi:zinc-ribbon domain-containing protein [Streptomyces anthocyanicus]|uniref:zinc-ribbon domain-containing protein n=1 Tax=Streptomyces anthocyanicus TaxID=68174 RepID=UPI0033B74903
MITYALWAERQGTSPPPAPSRMHDAAVGPQTVGRTASAYSRTSRETLRGTRSTQTGSPKLMRWRNPDCGHEWQETPSHREQGRRLRSHPGICTVGRQPPVDWRG